MKNPEDTNAAGVLGPFAQCDVAIAQRRKASNRSACRRQSKKLAGATLNCPLWGVISPTITSDSASGYGIGLQHIDAVDDAEDGAGGADAERERQDGGEREAGRFGRTDGKADVAQTGEHVLLNVVTDRHVPHVARRLRVRVRGVGEAIEMWTRMTAIGARHCVTKLSQSSI